MKRMKRITTMVLMEWFTICRSLDDFTMMMMRMMRMKRMTTMVLMEYSYV